MRTMMKVQMDMEAGSEAIADGSLPQLMQDVMERLEPESAYFGPEGGVRTAFIVFNLKDSSQLPALSEPLFSTVKANIQVFPMSSALRLEPGVAPRAERHKVRGMVCAALTGRNDVISRLEPDCAFHPVPTRRVGRTLEPNRRDVLHLAAGPATAGFRCLEPHCTAGEPLKTAWIG
jgi:hypothetical protein